MLQVKYMSNAMVNKFLNVRVTLDVSANVDVRGYNFVEIEGVFEEFVHLFHHAIDNIHAVRVGD